MSQINYACTAEISGEWYAVDVVAEHRPEEKQTRDDPGAAEQLTVTAIFYVEPATGMYEELPESEWSYKLLAQLIDDGMAFLKRRKDNDDLEHALFCADLELI